MIEGIAYQPSLYVKYISMEHKKITPISVLRAIWDADGFAQFVDIAKSFIPDYTGERTEDDTPKQSIANIVVLCINTGCIMQVDIKNNEGTYIQGYTMTRDGYLFMDTLNRIRCCKKDDTKVS